VALQAILNLAARRALFVRGGRLSVGEGPYPLLRVELHTAPPALIVKGNLSLLERLAAAIVGAQRARGRGGDSVARIGTGRVAVAARAGTGESGLTLRRYQKSPWQSAVLPASVAD